MSTQLRGATRATHDEANPLVSVVVNNYNNAEHLEACLDGLIAQTYSNIQIVVVDALSSDRSRAIIESYAARHDRIRTLYCSHYVPFPATTYNLGFLHCDGAFVAINDADDVSMPERIERQVRTLLENPTIGAVGCNCFEFNHNSNRLVETTVDKNVQNAIPPVRNPCLMFRRELIAEHGLWRWQCEYAADFEWLYRWYVGGVRFYVVQAPLVRFRKNDSAGKNISAKKATSQASKLALFRTWFGVRLFREVGLRWWLVTLKTYAYAGALMILPDTVLRRVLRRR